MNMQMKMGAEECAVQGRKRMLRSGAAVLLGGNFLGGSV